METNNTNIYLEFLTNLYGSLDDKIRQRILNYLETPTFGGWDDISSIIISQGFTTIWQHVLMIDPTFPTRGRSYGEQMRITREWERIPDPELVIEALKSAATKNTGINF